jgi:hypothetical protein
MTLTERLLDRILQFCSDRSITEREFGLSVANNHKLISRLRAGYGVNSQTHDRIIAFIEGSVAPGLAISTQFRQGPMLVPAERELLGAFWSTDDQGREMILRLAKSLRRKTPTQREAAA